MEKFGKALDFAFFVFMVAVVAEVGLIAVSFIEAGGPHEMCIGSDCWDILPPSKAQADGPAEFEEELMNRHYGEAVKVSLDEDGVEVWEFPPMIIKVAEIPDGDIFVEDAILTGTN